MPIKIIYNHLYLNRVFNKVTLIENYTDTDIKEPERIKFKTLDNNLQIHQTKISNTKTMRENMSTSNYHRNGRISLRQSVKVWIRMQEAAGRGLNSRTSKMNHRSRSTEQANTQERLDQWLDLNIQTTLMREWGAGREKWGSTGGENDVNKQRSSDQKLQQQMSWWARRNSNEGDAGQVWREKQAGDGHRTTTQSCCLMMPIRDLKLVAVLGNLSSSDRLIQNLGAVNPPP